MVSKGVYWKLQIPRLAETFLEVWSLDVLPVPSWDLFCYSSFLEQSKDMHVRLAGDFKAAGCKVYGECRANLCHAKKKPYANIAVCYSSGIKNKNSAVYRWAVMFTNHKEEKKAEEESSPGSPSLTRFPWRLVSVSRMFQFPLFNMASGK